MERPIQSNDKVFFLHIPKTAGTSLEASVAQNFNPDQKAPFMSLLDVRRGISPSVFAENRYFQGHIHYGLMCELLGREPVCLTMLREPLERYISDFAHMQRLSAHANAIDFDKVERVHAVLRQTSLQEFLNNPPPELALLAGNFQNLSLAKFDNLSITPELTLLVENFQNRQTRMIAAQIRLQSSRGPFPRVVEDPLPPETLLSRARERLESFAFFGLTERFQDSLFLLAYTFGWPPAVEYRRLNVAPSRPRLEDLPSATLERLSAVNALDQALYACAQELFQARFEQMSSELLERYATRRQASLRLPLSPEILIELLEKHYARRFCERTPAASAVDVHFDRAIPGDGWHFCERHPQHGAYRWTGPGRQARLYFHLLPGRTDLEVEFRVIGFLDAEVLNSLRLQANGQPIQLHKHQDNAGGIYFKGMIPGSLQASDSGLLRLVLQVERTLAPNVLDAANLDGRLLGIAINRFLVRPVNQACSKPSDSSLVSIIVLAYNGQAYLRACLAAVGRQDYPNFETIVVDNASRDGSAALVRREFPGVQLIENRRNLGFAGGNNLAMRLARGEIIVLLNQDTVVEPTWLSELVKAMQSDPAIGIAGCKIYNPDGRTLQHAGGWFLPNGLSNHYGRDEIDEGQYEQQRPVEYVTGAALAVRRQVIERCGVLDPGYFPAYFEESDWCLRARKAGYQVVYVPQARLVHHESVWSSVTSSRYLYTYHKNRLRFVLKNYTLAQFVAALKFEISWLRRYKPPRVLWLAYAVNFLRLPMTLASRWYQSLIQPRNA